MAQSNDYLITGSSDHSIKIWNVAAPTTTETFGIYMEPYLNNLINANNPNGIQHLYNITRIRECSLYVYLCIYTIFRFAIKHT
jgi:WD40 repeat protein